MFKPSLNIFSLSYYYIYVFNIFVVKFVKRSVGRVKQYFHLYLEYIFIPTS